MVLVKHWPLFHFFIFGNIGQQNFFYGSLELKNAFLGYKIKKYKRSKNSDFSEVVSPWFWAKIGFFATKIITKHYFLWYF